MIGCKSSSQVSCTIGVIIAILLLQAAAYAQVSSKCAPELLAADRATGNARELQQEQDKAEDEFATLMTKALQNQQQMSSLRGQIGNLEALFFFTVEGSEVRKKLADIRKVLEDRLKLLTEQQAKLREVLPKRMAEVMELRDNADLAQRAAQAAIDRLRQCFTAPATTSATPPAPQPPAVFAGGSTFELVNVTSDPAAPYSGWTWTAGGGQINYRDSSGAQETFEWTQPPQRFGPDGFPIQLKVQSTSGPRSRANAGIHVNGDFDRAPSTGIEALSENGQTVTNQLRVIVTPSRAVSSPGDYYLRVGADYGPSFIYHYRVNR